MGLAYCKTRYFTAVTAAPWLPAFILTLRTNQLIWTWIILSSRSLDVQHAYNQNSLPELKEAVYVWEAREDPKGRERKGRIEFLVNLSSGSYLSLQKNQERKKELMQDGIQKATSD